MTSFNSGNITVSGGAALSLPGVTSYTGNTTTTTLEATGTGSSLTLANLASVTEGANNYAAQTQFEALAGGTVTLSALKRSTPARWSWKATATDSALNVAALTSFAETGGWTYSTFQASNGGTVDDGNLASLSNVNLNVAGTGENLTLGNLTSFNTGNITVSGGATLSLPGVTSYTGNTLTTTLEATGTGSSLTLDNLASVTEGANNYAAQTQFEALAGGTVTLSALKTINTGTVVLESDGTGSVLNVAALTSFMETNGWTGSTLQASNGGTVNGGGLASSSSVNVVVAGTGESLTLGGLESFDSGNFTVSGGAELTLPPPTSFTAAGSTMNVSGSGSSVAIGIGILDPPPGSGADVTINVPQFPQGMTLNLDPNGTFSGVTTFNVGAGAVVNIQGGTYTGGTTYNVGQGATVDLTGGQTVTYSGTLTGSGSGTVQFSSGTLTVGVGGLSLNFGGNLFQWTGGGLEASGGNITNLGTINLSGSNETQLYADGALDDYGTIIQTGTGDFGLHSDNVLPSTLMIEPGGLYLIESNAGVNNLYNSNVIDNAGTIKKTGGTGTSTLGVDGPLINTGTIEVDSGTLSLDPTSFSQLSSGTLAAGSWNALNGSTLAFPSGTNITTNEANIALDMVPARQSPPLPV